MFMPWLVCVKHTTYPPFRTALISMSRRSHSTSPSPRSPKRARIEHLTSANFKDGVFLAPMVRSGACRLQLSLCDHVFIHGISLVPTRLFALKHGASLVWGPEMVDKAILHAERVVDRESPPTSIVVYGLLEY
jgi:tRNA-dihydrouridine synthase 2